MSTMIERKAHPRVGAAISRLGLTPRQGEIVEALTFGLRHDALAQELNISRSTLRSHFRHIFSALNVSNRVELMARVLADVVEDADRSSSAIGLHQSRHEDGWPTGDH